MALAPRSATDLFGDPAGSHPEWYRQNAFLQPEFDCKSYVSDLRTFVPFDALRSELRAHSASLNHDLIDLVNRNYGEFVNLSTQLVDFDSVIVRMRAPVTEFREKIATLKASLEASFAALQKGLQQSADASDVRETLERLLDTLHVMLKVEKLVKELSSVSEQWSDTRAGSTNNDAATNGINSQITENGTSLRDTQSTLLERIASEMNRLKFYIAHSKNLPFIENMEKRIQSATLILDKSLGHCFADGLEQRDANAVHNCLRAYAAIDDNRDAEEYFRKVVVSPLVQKVIPYDSLEFSAASKDELEDDYQQLKKYIKTDCKFLLAITFAENSGLHGFNFLANSILKEVLLAIQKGKPGAFSPGRPSNFLKNYKSSLDFLSYLEGYCPLRSDVTKFRAEPIYADFLKLWNLGVYISLRFQEIAGALDSILTGDSLQPVIVSNGEGTKGLVLKQSVTLLESLRSCWREDVFVDSCSDKFVRLSLQLLSRYTRLLLSGLAARKMGDPGAKDGPRWALSAQTTTLIYVIHDVRNLASEIRGNYVEDVVELLKPWSTEALDLVRQSFLIAEKSLADVEPEAINAIVDSLVEKSIEDLRQMKGITATYRMTNKPLPARHSPYVSNILRPVKTLLGGVEAEKYLASDTRNKLLHETAVGITGRYHELASELVSLARKTESSLQRIRQGAQRRVGGSSEVSDQNVSDTDKICMQLFLDVQEYGRTLCALGLDAKKIPSYCLLWQCVAPSEKQHSIYF